VCCTAVQHLLLLLLCGFQPPVRYSTQADQVVVVRDFDGDGAPEIITSGNQVDELGSFSLLPNRGDGSFASERLVASAFGERVEDAGTDLLVSNYWSNGIGIYRGKGSLQFDAEIPFATATHGGPSLFADYDHDGVTDVVSFSFGSGNPVRVHLFHGLGDGTLAPKTTIDTTLANAGSPSARTINGALEILVSEHFGRLALIRFLNGTISITNIAAGPGIDTSSTFADINGDGVADIVDVNTATDDASRESIFVTLARADGTFRDRKQLAGPRRVAFPTKVRAADLDGDGRTDLVVSDFRATNVFYFRGDGAGDFAEGVAIDVGGPVNDFEIADVNSDGRPDLVTANEDHSVSVVINRGPCPPARRRVVVAQAPHPPAAPSPRSSRGEGRRSLRSARLLPLAPRCGERVPQAGEGPCYERRADTALRSNQP